MNKNELDILLHTYTYIEKLLFDTAKDCNDPIKQCIAKKINYMNFRVENFSLFIKKDPISSLVYPNVSLINELLNFNSKAIAFSRHPFFFVIPEHYHSYIEIVYVYSGKCIHTINGQRIIMETGQLCLLNTGTLHSIEPAGENDIFINCLMSKNYLDDILLLQLSGNDLFSNFFIQTLYNCNSSNNYILFLSEKSDKLNNLITDVLCEYFQKSSCSSGVISSYMILIFSELLKIYITSTDGENYNLLKNTNISDIIIFIQNNYKAVTLTSVAEHFHFHPNYLSNIIKNFTGKNFKDFIHETRLKKACFLLENSNLHIAEICQKIGYEDVKFFYKLFKKYYGKTPGNYRKSSVHNN